MMRNKAVVAALVASMALGTFSVPSQARSRGYCDAYARDVANHRAGAQQVVGGAVVGALLGAGVGAILGGHHAVRDGAIIGGVGGTVGGGVYANKKWRKVYNRTYADCRSW